MSRYVVLKDGTEIWRCAAKREAQTIAASYYKGGRIMTIQDLQAKEKQRHRLWQFDPSGAFYPVAG